MSNEIIDEPENNWTTERRKSRKMYSERGPGLFILFIGILLLLKTADLVAFPHWFFSGPMLILSIGFLIGFKRNFRGGPWWILMLIGTLLLVDKINPALNIDRFNWPIIFIVIGLVFILRPKKNRKWNQKYYMHDKETNGNVLSIQDENQGDRRDFIDVTAIFGGVKQNVLTKTFKGGDILSFMGGSEIDMTQADFTGPVRIDVTNVFGGTKLLVPSSWDVQNDIMALFGGVDDKRKISGVNLDTTKVLILDGTCLFGGIEIRSF